MSDDMNKSQTPQKPDEQHRRDEAIRRMIASLQNAEKDTASVPDTKISLNDDKSNTSASMTDENPPNEVLPLIDTVMLIPDTEGETKQILHQKNIDHSDANKDEPLKQDKAHLEPLEDESVNTDSQSMLPIDTPKILDSQAIAERQEGVMVSTISAPWTLQQFFNGEIDLDVELTRRFPAMPMMSLIKFRALGTRQERSVATLSTQDGSATLTIDADKTTKIMQMSFTVNSMLTLRFGLRDLSDMDRGRWLDLMQREQGGLAFLWGSARWTQDYMVCIARKYHTNLYAFSPSNFEAAVRLKPDVTRKLLDWLKEIWSDEVPDEEDPPQLLTW